MNLAYSISLYAGGPVVKDFNPADEKKINKILQSLPARYKKNFKKIIPDANLGAKHGEYDRDENRIRLHPKIFHEKVKFGTVKSTPQWRHVTLHEIGHAVRHSLLDAEWNQWLQISGWKKGKGAGQAAPYKEVRPGWKKKTSKWTHAQDAKFTRRYQQRNPGEDFADNFSYILNGNAKQVPEEKRNFILRVLDRLK